jgi:hypothetical protein
MLPQVFILDSQSSTVAVATGLFTEIVCIPVIFQEIAYPWQPLLLYLVVSL